VPGEFGHLPLVEIYAIIASPSGRVVRTACGKCLHSGRNDMPLVQHDEIEVIQSIWREDPSKGRELKPGQRVQRFAYIALLLMALTSLFALGTDVSNYTRSITSARGLSLEITSLQVIDDDNPRALIHFRVRNNSPLEVKIERYNFEIYLNEERVGSSYSTYLGMDPSVDPEAHREATYVNQVLAPGRNLGLEFTIYIYSAQMEIIRQAQRSGSMSWYASAKFTMVLPYSREENWVRLRARFEE